MMLICFLIDETDLLSFPQAGTQFHPAALQTDSKRPHPPLAVAHLWGNFETVSCCWKY